MSHCFVVERCSLYGCRLVTKGELVERKCGGIMCQDDMVKEDRDAEISGGVIWLVVSKLAKLEKTKKSRD